MTDTHKPCGNGHSKPKGKDCGICANLAGGLKEKVDEYKARRDAESNNE